jgi:hypothetical protein
VFEIVVKIKTFNNRLKHRRIVLSRGLGTSEKLMEQHSLQRVATVLRPPIFSGYINVHIQVALFKKYSISNLCCSYLFEVKNL